MNYPETMTERATLDYAINGGSIARLGDGELRIVLGGRAKSQAHDYNLARELRHILQGKGNAALPCIPNLRNGTPKMWFWHTYEKPKFVGLYTGGPYGSTWVTRGDDAPHINTKEYWEAVARLWKGKDVTLVRGDDRSLTPELLAGARSIREVMGPHTDAYSQVDRIEQEIGSPMGPVLMCLGATATVLAERLARKGVHAVDVGHVGMFIKRWRKENARA